MAFWSLTSKISYAYPRKMKSAGYSLARNFLINWDTVHTRLNSNYKRHEVTRKKYEKHIGKLITKNPEITGIH